MEKAFTLPLVTDTYTYLATTSAPLQPYMDTAVTAVSPVVETSLATLQATLAPHAEKVPEVVKAKVTQATEQVIISVLDLYLLPPPCTCTPRQGCH